MRKIIIVLLVCFVGFSANAQKKKRNAKVSFQVDGICLMCKTRIEKVALKTAGVKFASWNVETHKLSLIINERKVDTLTIQKKIALVGHDTFPVKATKEAYASLHGCCKYKDILVIEDHEKGKKKTKKKQ